MKEHEADELNRQAINELFKLSDFEQQVRPYRQSGWIVTDPKYCNEKRSYIIWVKKGNQKSFSLGFTPASCQEGALSMLRFITNLYRKKE